MHLIDWIFTAIPLLIVFGIGAYTRRYIRSVADFMSGGRLAGRYLLAVAQGELQSGAVVFVALFEIIAKSGFTMSWWLSICTLASFIVSISGFVIYRYRETRAMTLAQFFEIRYSKSFRLFTGILGFVAGILNFGIIPVLGARFFAYFWGLPATLSIFSVNVPTYILLLTLFLGISVSLTLSGGVITVLVTNCIEGILSQVFYLVIIFTLLALISWSQISEVLGNQPSGESLLNPFDCSGLKDFNLGYVLMYMFIGVYSTMAWQNASGYNSAPLTSHESRMGGVLGRWREMGRLALVTLLGVSALTFLHHPAFSAQAAPAIAAVQRIHDPQTREQMLMPIAAAHLLPTGVKGVFCVIMLMGIFGGDSTHLHSWSSIFIQDVLVPLRKKPLTPRQHIRWLRLSVVGVGFFAFVFGILFPQTQYIVMWWQVTGAIYIGGAGATLIGGLYWKKGTTAGAWVAMITGSVLATGGILLQTVYGSAFPLNGMQISFLAAVIAIGLYVIVSLLTNKEDFNMDRMLHRGRYAAISALVGEEAPAAPRGKVWLGRLIGLDESFSPADKWVACSLFGWSLFWFIVFVIGTVWNWVTPWPKTVWSTYWNITGIGMPIILAVVTSIWFTWGGLRDMRNLFSRLQQARANPLDNGTVVGHQNLDEIALEETLSETVGPR